MRNGKCIQTSFPSRSHYFNSYLWSLAHNNPFQHQWRLMRPYPIQHIRKVSHIPSLTRYRQLIDITPFTQRNILQCRHGFLKSRLSCPTQETCQYRRCSTFPVKQCSTAIFSASAFNHDSILNINLSNNPSGGDGDPGKL